MGADGRLEQKSGVKPCQASLTAHPVHLFCGTRKNPPNSLCKPHALSHSNWPSQELASFRLATILAQPPWLHSEFGEFLRVCIISSLRVQYHTRRLTLHYSSLTPREQFLSNLENHRLNLARISSPRLAPARRSRCGWLLAIPSTFEER